MNRTSLAVALALLTSSLTAQSLVLDLAPAPSGDGSSAITDIVVAGGKAFFAAGGPWGRELYVSDGTAAGTRLVKDLGTVSAGNPGASSSPSEITALGNSVLFAATVEGLGRELWKSDGTAAGTVLLKDLAPGGASGSPAALVAMGNLVYFAAFDGTGSGLWVTDGTTAGTTSVFSGGAAPTGLAVVGSTLYFSLAVPGSGTELWRSDGTLAGTTLVVDLVAVGSSSPTELTPFLGGLLFRATVPGSGSEPYFTDGTAAGTVALADLAVGAGSSNPAQFTPLGSLAVFTANNGVAGQELFVTDGTAAGTGLLRDIFPGVGSGSPAGLYPYQGHVYFRATDGVNGFELWRTDGTVAGTALFADLGAGGASPSDFVQVGNDLWFAAADGVHGREPWQTDGTVAGTFMVRDVTIPFSSSPTAMVPFGAGVLCSLTDPATNAEIGFVGADGATGGVLVDIQRGFGDSAPDDFVAIPGGAFFTATSQAIGREAFFTDGTAAGTAGVDIWPGAPGAAPSQPVANGSEVFFSAAIGVDRELWKSDGTPGGTVQLSDIPGTSGTSPFALAAVGSGVVFRGSTPGIGSELWASDGTPAGTAMILEITPGAGSTGIDAIVGNGTRALFAAFQAAIGTELWSTDGTTAGTFVIELNPGAGSSSPQHLVEANGRIFFSASAGSSRVLWVSDGTLTGTTFVNAVGLTAPFALTPSGNRVFGRASIAGIGQELFVSDGTQAGSVGIDLFAGIGSSTITSLTGAAGGAFFLFDAQDGNGTELWFSDGTQAGTAMVLDIAPGAANGPVADTLVPILGGAQVAFVANDLQHGMQLWTSDGTAAGTVPATGFGGDGVGAARFGRIRAVAGEVYFAANDGLLGLEAWRLSSGSAFIVGYGGGCAGAAQPVPQIQSSGGDAVIGNLAFSVDVGNAVPDSLAPLFLGFRPANIDLGLGCTALLPAPLISFGVAFTDAAGAGAVPVPLPNDPANVGLSVFFQYAVLSPTGPLLGFLDLSAGLHVQIGN